MDEKKVEEYGLIDVISVLLRYWKFLVVGVLAVAIAVLVTFFIRDKTTFTGSMHVVLTPVPLALAQVLPETVEKTFNSGIRTTKSFDQALQNQEIDQDLRKLYLENIGSFYSQIVDPLNKERKLLVTVANSSPEAVTYQISFTWKDKKSVELVLPEVSKYLTEQVRQKILITIDKTYKLYQSLIDEAKAKSGAGIDAGQIAIYLQLDKIVKDTGYPVQTISPVTITETHMPIFGMTVTKAIIVVGGALILFIIISFIMDYIRRIRLDEHQMGKLRDALKPSKK